VEDQLSLNLTYTDVANAFILTDNGAALTLPTARDVRLSCIALGHDDPSSSYFGADDVRFGSAVVINVRQDATTETALYSPGLPASQLRGVFCQPDSLSALSVPFTNLTFNGSIAKQLGPNLITTPNIGSRLATTLGLQNDGLSIRASIGRRVIFGAADSISHVISPDGASLKFSNQTDIANHWIVAIRLTLNRDWSWDGLQPNGFIVSRDGLQVGKFGLTRVVNSDAFSNAPGAKVDRTGTDLVFFDQIDPKPPLNTFPKPLSPVYTITCLFKGTPPPTGDPPLVLKSLTLPITTPPAQVPTIVSAGIAPSAFLPSVTYSSTTPRTKRLRIEFSSPPADPQDRYFARVLRRAPDSVITV
jgi:hypothetical protein